MWVADPFCAGRVRDADKGRPLPVPTSGAWRSNGQVDPGNVIRQESVCVGGGGGGGGGCF